MSVKCGHCGSYGQTVAHVRECSNPSGRAHLKNLVAAQPVVVPEPEPQAAPVPTLAEAPQEGVYVFHSAGNDPVWYKVVQSQTGNFYAKQYVSDNVWEYIGRGPLHFLTALDRVTAEQASRFGQLTNHCVFCSRQLTDDRSIAVGYGEICAGHNGLPWGELA